MDMENITICFICQGRYVVVHTNFMLPTVAPGFEPRSGQVGFTTRRQVFPLPILFPPLAPYSSSIIRG